MLPLKLTWRGAGAPIPQLPTTRWLGTTRMTAAEVVVGRTVDRREIVEPHLTLVIGVRERGVGRLAAPRTGTTTTHALDGTALTAAGRGPMEYVPLRCRCGYPPVYP